MDNQFEITKDIDVKRILGRYPSNPSPGPVLLVSAGVHGNEPSGLLALKRVFNRLDEQKPQIKGQLIGVSGNLRALKEKVRLIDRDLNRVCTPENAQKIRNGEKLAFHEGEEFGALLELVDRVLKEPFAEKVVFLDLHTTSSPTSPYISVNKQKESYDFAMEFPLPVVRGIEKYIPGHFDHYLTLEGHVGFTVEAGQHAAPESVDYHEASIVVALVKAGLASEEQLADYSKLYRMLEETFGGDEGYEVVFRHHIQEDETFEMEPGYSNFDKINEGELLAHADGEPIYSPMDGRIFMPLYQSQGNDGFFIVS